MTATASNEQADEPAMGPARRLLFIVNVDWFFCSHRLPIAIEAIKRGYEVHIATEVTNRGDELQRQGLHVHPISIRRGYGSVRGEIATLRQLIRVCRKVRPDIAHLITIKPVLLGSFAARFAAVPSVVAAISGQGFVSLAEGWRARLRRSLVATLYWLAFRRSGLTVIFQNKTDQASLSQMARLSDDQCALIRGSGVDLNLFSERPLPDGPPCALMACRLLTDKGVWEFVQAAEDLKSKGFPGRFVLVGDIDPDNPASLTQDDVDTIRRTGAVELWGHREDMASVLPEAHVVVLPSYREGLPKVLVEAAACGRAVVTTDVPGCRDAITPDETGILVPARSTADLADAMHRLLTDPAAIRSMGRKSRELAETAFGIDMIVEQHLTVYKELVEQRRGPS